MRSHRTALPTLFALAVVSLSGTAFAEDYRTLDRSHVDHQIGSARAAMVRLEYHGDRHCVERCARYEIDLVIADRAMQSLENYVNHALSGRPIGALDRQRIDHAVFAAKAAIGRLDHYAVRQTDAHRLRMTTDVSILDRALTNLANYVRRAPNA